LGWALDDLLTEEPGPAPQASAPVTPESRWHPPHRSASRTALRPVASAAQETSVRPGPGHAPGAPASAAAFASAAGSSPAATLEAPPLDAPRTDARPLEEQLTTAPRLHDTMPLVAAPPAKARRKAKANAQAPAPPQMVVNGLVLPTPPEDEEKYNYVRRHAWLITLLGSASFPLLVFSQVRMMLIYHWFWLYGPFVILSAIFLALPMFTDAMSRGFDFKGHRRLVAAWQPPRYPSVDVFLPVCGEPIEVLRNTWKYVSLMSRHYQGTVTAYVLDDSHNPELKALAARFGFVYATRPNRGWFK